MSKHTKHYQNIRDRFVLRDSSNDNEIVDDEDEELVDDDSTLNTVIIPLLNRR